MFREEYILGTQCSRRIFLGREDMSFIISFSFFEKRRWKDGEDRERERERERELAGIFSVKEI